jgi:hypothetical protein
MAADLTVEVRAAITCGNRRRQAKSGFLRYNRNERWLNER